MDKKKKINKANSGFYKIKLKNGLNTKDWLYHWFIIKNLFRGKGYILYENRDAWGDYIDITGYHNANTLESEIWIKETPRKKNLYSFLGAWRYEKEENKNSVKELENLFKKYFNLNKIEITDININNWEKDYYVSYTIE